MVEDKGLLERLKARGEEVFTQLSSGLMSNRHFLKAMEKALQGKQKLDEAAGRALKSMNVPTRGEFKKALARIEALEHEIAALRARPGRRTRARRSKKAAARS